MESLLPLSVFVFVSSITPGPNNIMLTSSTTGAILRPYLTQAKWQRLFCAIMITLTLYSAFAIWS